MDRVEFVTSYHDRLGLEVAGGPDSSKLRELHAAHLRRVPFENLSIHLGERLDLGIDALQDKVLRHHRGGFCYELNGILAKLLEDLGYGVSLLGARVWSGSGFGPPLDHLALRVDCVGETRPWLVDVGFGAHSLYPLLMEPGLPQHDPGGTFVLEKAGCGDWDVLRDGLPQYRIEDHPRVLSDFEAMCWYQQTSPQSHFSRSIICTIQTDHGRATISGNRFIRTEGDDKQERLLPDDTTILETYRTVFGISLDQPPNVEAARLRLGQVSLLDREH